ncbi:MAG: hypothetical protein Q9170_007839 [Blastenia crenularia]
MATGNPPTPLVRQAFNHQAPLTPQNVATPPSKRDLTSWWKNFKKNSKKEEEKPDASESPPGIFGIALQDSIKYANVAISLTNESGQSYIYGYVPIVVAKCGVYLKEKATDVEGIFRLSGSNKRIKELQTVFDSPDRYGKGLDWTGYTVHDAANILRRYLNNLPQPIVPLEFYERFRDPLRSHQAQAVGTGEQEVTVQDTGDFDHATAITTYQRLITELPPLNRQLLLYILDLLAVFSSKSDLNRMNSGNLSAIFQPGLLSHPSHDMEPKEYRLSQDVLIFLIENQDSFLVGMSGTAADEKTVKEVQSGAQTRQPSSPMTPPSGIGRSSSNASGAADSLRRLGGLRRNVSVSSSGSKKSLNIPSPAGSTPGSPHTAGSGVHRSNTVPSKKSPGIPSRFSRPLNIPSSTENTAAPTNNPTAEVRALSPGAQLAPSNEIRSSSTHSSVTPTAEKPAGLGIAGESRVRTSSREEISKPESLTLQPPTPSFSKPESGTPAKERKLSGLFTKSPTSDSERKEGRQPKKLRKKRPESSNPSAQSSTHSLHGFPDSPAGQAFYTPLPTPNANSQSQADPMATASTQPPPLLSNTSATPTSEAPPENETAQKVNHLSSHVHSPPLEPSKSPAPSIRSRTSAADVTSQSEAEHVEDLNSPERKKEKRHRWRFSSSAKKNGEIPTSPSKPSEVPPNPVAKQSFTSIVSSEKLVQGSPVQAPEQPAEGAVPSKLPASSAESTPSKEREVPREKEVSPEPAEKRGPIGWIKGKVAKVKEERKERGAEKERAKSPQRSAIEGRSGSKQSLSAIANEGMTGRGRSMDVKREGIATNGVTSPVFNGAPHFCALQARVHLESRTVIAMWSRPGILTGVLFGLLAIVNSENVKGRRHDGDSQANVEEFSKLLDQVDPPSLHAALHDYSPKKFKHGMFKEDRTAVEAIHREQPSLASSIVAMAKRQDIPSNGTAPASSPAAGNSPTTTPVAESPTDAGQSPTTAVVATPIPVGPVEGSVIGTPTTTVDSSPNAPGAAASTSISPNGAGSTPSTSAGGNGGPSSAATTPAPGSTPSFTAGEVITTTDAQGNAVVSTLTDGQVITTTNAQGVTIVSTVGGGYVTLSGSTGGRSATTSNTASTRNTRRSSSTSVVLHTTTLPDGSQSTVTAVTVVPGSNGAAATPSGSAGAGGGSGTQGGNPALQTGVAGKMGGQGWELICLLGAAVGWAMMM